MSEPHREHLLATVDVKLLNMRVDGQDIVAVPWTEMQAALRQLADAEGLRLDETVGMRLVMGVVGEALPVTEEPAGETTSP